MRSWGDVAPGGTAPRAELTAGLGITVPRDGVLRSSAEGETATQEAVAPSAESPVTSETSLDGAPSPLALNSPSGTTTTRKPRAPAVRAPEGVPGTGGAGGGAAGAPPSALPSDARGGGGGPLYVSKCDRRQPRRSSNSPA